MSLVFMHDCLESIRIGGLKHEWIAERQGRVWHSAKPHWASVDRVELLEP